MKKRGFDHMKNLFKKTWFLGTLMIGLLLIVFLMNLWIMSLKLTVPYEEDTLWTLGSNLSSGGNINIFAFVFVVMFYVSIIPILLSGFSLLKKNHFGFMIAFLYMISFQTTLVVFQSVFQSLPVFAIILMIFNIILLIGVFVLSIFRIKALKNSLILTKNDLEIKLSQTKIPLAVLIIDVISILVFLTTFFVPIYSTTESGVEFNAVIIRVLLMGETQIDVIAYFLANFVIFLGIFLYFAKCISDYFFNQEKFILHSKTLVAFSFIATLVFFVTGLVMYMLNTLGGIISQTYAFIPLFLMLVVIIIYAVFNGKFNAYQEVVDQEKTLRYAKIEPLLYVFALTTVSVLMLLLKIIKINITSGALDYFVELTGFDILRDYANLDPGYRIIAYILVVMLISIGLCLVIAVTSYLSKYRQFNSMVKLAASVNVFFVFIIAISGYYFQIAQEINEVVILDVISFYGINLPSFIDFEYTITTDAIYALFGSVSVLILMFVRKAFDRDDMNLQDAQLSVSSPELESTQNTPSTETLEETLQAFDPCPAFTDLDSKVSMYQADVEHRRTLKTSAKSLNELVNFVVEYARNSRLHLSYTPEDIATFVAGLGASKLSILQGMSGTGKTSLPKIFSEAIFGNCDIIEVESSWKDKNELLGYYNEFSMKYTPKKFTLALYKAKLNPEIMTFILLDEMNLSRIEYYFSDFLSLMENEENHREIKLINIKLSRQEQDQDMEYLALDSGNTLKVSPNIWFIGTANRDESTFVISDKVYDRSHTMNFIKRAPKVRNYSNPMSKQYYDYQTINQLFVAAKEKGKFDAENSELIKNVETLLAPYNISFGNRILKQIEDFVNIYNACFANEDVESEAIEKILLSKVVAKLEVKTIDDKEKLEMDFEKLNLKLCAQFVRRLDNE